MIRRCLHAWSLVSLGCSELSVIYMNVLMWELWHSHKDTGSAVRETVFGGKVILGNFSTHQIVIE